MSLLWKSELSHILAENSMPGYAHKSKKFIAEKLIARIPANELHKQISEELFERDYTTIRQEIQAYRASVGKKPRKKRSFCKRSKK